MRDGRAEDEPPALDPDHRVDALALEGRRQHVDGHPVSLRITQQRRDVVEENAGLRKVWNVADMLFEVHSPPSHEEGATEAQRSRSVFATKALRTPRLLRRGGTKRHQ